MKKWGIVLVLLVAVAGELFSQAYPAVTGDKFVLKQTADHAVKVNKKTAALTRVSGSREQWLQLKGKADASQAAPDAIFRIKAPVAGTYQLSTYAMPADHTVLAKDKNGNIPPAYIKIQIGNERPTKRILYDLYQGSKQVSGKFELSGDMQDVKIWLPDGIKLGHIEWQNYNTPEVPLAARQYVPKIVPPGGHPRLWVTPYTLPLIRWRLTRGENRPAWEKAAAAAKQPFSFAFDPQQEIFHREDLEKAVEYKAFYYLMTGDKTIGQEAVNLMGDYLSVLEFGNVTHGDITREIGRAVYTAALVYDWCFDLLNASQKHSFYRHMLRLARDMEIGWPPFMDSIINGHGNEAQISRDLLAMSIALYDTDPLLYQYTAYTVLEQLVPMRKFEYASPRHNQGVDYGAYRLGWEMHAAWLFYRMTGMTVFDDNIKTLPYYWLYTRLPDGYMLRDGDMFSVKGNGTQKFYWKQPQTMLLSYTYAHDPLLKGEFERQGGLPDNPILYLLVNDPDMQADHNVAKLPLTMDFGTVLGSMIARTGWDTTAASNNVIAEIKGGGYHFGNHQHADAGALQIYYHGMQVGDIGLYLSYGPPYDFNFNKRSISHSLMLAVDPAETLHPRAQLNDGGSRFNQRFPTTPEETVTDHWFNNGYVQSAAMGPSPLKPAFSYFKADLTGAYSAKMSRYTRGFCFLHLNREDVPAVVILTDDMQTADPSFAKYWQINTLQQPEVAGEEIILRNSLNGQTGETHVNMLIPAKAERKQEILSGKAANSTFGTVFDVKSARPEANGHRIMISPKKARSRDRFLTVFQMTAGGKPSLPVVFNETADCYIIRIADRIVAMSAGTDFIQSAFSFDVPANGTFQAALTGLAPGFWHVKSADGKVSFNVYAAPGKNAVFFDAAPGQYTVTPGRNYAAGLK